MAIPKHLIATEPEAQYVIRTEAPCFIGRIDPEARGAEVLYPAGCAPIVVEQWIDECSSPVEIKAILTEIAEFMTNPDDLSVDGHLPIC